METKANRAERFVGLRAGVYLLALLLIRPPRSGDKKCAPTAPPTNEPTTISPISSLVFMALL
jgi:hypothetical protein